MNYVNVSKTASQRIIEDVTVVAKNCSQHVPIQQLTLSNGYLWSNCYFLLSEAVPTMLVLKLVAKLH